MLKNRTYVIIWFGGTRNPTYLPNSLQLDPQAQQYAIADAKCCRNLTSSVSTKLTSN